jgi:O-antigen ligase
MKHLPKFINYTLWALAFFLPIKPQISTIAIIVVLLCSLFIVKRSDFKNFTLYKVLLLMLLFYGCHILGLFYSNNMQYGFKDLEYKLSFLVFPILLINVSAIINRTYIYFAFILGCITSTSICLVIAFKNYLSDPVSTHFFYTKFCLFMHPTYFGMYCNAAILMLISGHSQIKSKAIFMFLVCAGVVTLVLIASRMASIVTVVTLIACAYHYVLKKENKIWHSIMIALMLAVVFQLYATNYFNRYTELQSTIATQSVVNPVTQHTSSSDSRLLLWQYATQVWSANVSNFVFGVGTGDIKDELQHMYIKHNFNRAIEEHYNPHNQYLHTAVALGCVGLSMLLLIFIYGFTYGNLLGIYFLFIVALNALTESVLEVQSGIIFFCFFCSLIFTTPKTHSQ